MDDLKNTMMQKDQSRMQTMTADASDCAQCFLQNNGSSDNEPYLLLALHHVLSVTTTVSKQGVRDVLPSIDYNALLGRLIACMEDRVEEEVDDMDDDDSSCSDNNDDSQLVLSKSAMLAAGVYIKILAMSGSVAIGWNALDALSVCSNVLRRLRTETNGLQTLSSRNGGQKQLLLDENDDNEDLFDGEGPWSDRVKALWGRNMAMSLAGIPIHDDFGVWNADSVQVLLESACGCMITLQAWGYTDAASTLQTSIVEVLCPPKAPKESFSRHSPNSQDDDAMSIDSDDRSEDSETKSSTSLQRRHQMTLVVLRSFYPVLLHQHTLANGEAGKQSASQLASHTLQLLLSNLRVVDDSPRAGRASVASTAPPSLTPKRTPTLARSNNKNRRLSVSAKKSRRNSLTPKPAAAVYETPSRPALPCPVLRTVLGFLQKLATAPLETSSMRQTVLATLQGAVPLLPLLEQSRLLQFLADMFHSKVVVHRLVAVDLVAILLPQEWMWDNYSLPTHSPKAPSNLLIAFVRNLQDRLDDKSPTIRASAVTALGKLCPILLDKAVVDEMDVLDSLRLVASQDEKATVRKAATGALAQWLVTCETRHPHTITEEDVVTMSDLCRDRSIMTRKAAAEGLTDLVSCVTAGENTIGPIVEKAWSSSTLTMVLDGETGCVSKAVELVERLLFFPILDALETERVARTTAWRILASLGDDREGGSSRNEMEALRAALNKSIVASNDSKYRTCIIKTARETAVNAIRVSNQGDLFAAEVEHQRTGAWVLFGAAMGISAADRKEVLRMIKKSRIDLGFVADSWRALLDLYMGDHTPETSKPYLSRAMKTCLEILSQLAALVDSSTSGETSIRLQSLLGSFCLPPEAIGSGIAALTATSLVTCNNDSEQTQHAHCVEWIRSLYGDCETRISQSGRGSLTEKDVATLTRALFTAGELSLVGFSSTDDSGPQEKVDSSAVLARGLYVPPTKQLVEIVQAFMADKLPGNVALETPDSVRGHAFVALGKFCLRDAGLAKRSLNILARELHNDVPRSWKVQSNALLILGDLCVRYTSMADRFLPVMAGCLQVGVTDMSENILLQPVHHGASVVRKHAVLLLSSLLLQDYIKWRGLLFHRFLVASVDEDDDVAATAEAVLYGPLLNKQPRLFSGQFVESLFVLNRCTAHPIYRAASAMGDGGSGISVGFDGINLSGEIGRLRRMKMYETMLSKMADEEKIEVTARIGKEVFGSALKSGSHLNQVCTNTDSAHPEIENAANVLRDAFAVLINPAMRVGKATNEDDEMVDVDAVPNKAKKALAARGRLLSSISRKQLIETFLPILCNLKTVLEKSCSPLLKDLMACLLDMYKRFKSEAQECLANDPTTLQEIEFDAQQQQKARLLSRRGTLVSVQ